MNYKLTETPVDEIVLPDAPLEANLQMSLIEGGVNEEPIRLRPTDKGKYEIVNGRRRVVALVENGYQGKIPALVEDMSDERAHWLALLLNSGTPNELDEAEHILSLMADGYTQKEIAKRVGFSETKVSQRIKLYQRLIEPLKDKLRKGEITYTAALKASGLPFKDQEILLDGSLTQKAVDVSVREFKSSIIADKLPNFDPEIKPGLFLTSDQVERLLSGTHLVVEWDGKDLILSGSEK